MVTTQTETDSELKYQDEIHGLLISQADKVVDLIFTKYLKAQISYDGVIRVETYPFPKETIREAIEVILQFPTLSQKKISIMLDEKYSKVKFYMEELKKKKIIYREILSGSPIVQTENLSRR